MTQESGNPGTANLPIGIPKTANQEIGGPRGEEANQEIRGPREENGEGQWHSRGYLPHFDQPERVQHVTFHLGDSLPRHVVEQMEEETKLLPPEKQDVERRKRMEAWLDAGHGSCVLRLPEIARKVQESLLFFDGLRYRMFAWVVMPNHVHTLFVPMSGWTVRKIVASWKKFTARLICDYQRTDPGNANLPIGILKAANQEIGVPRKNPREVTHPGGGVPGESSRVWHREFRDRFIRDERHFERALEYIHANPVTAGLVKEAEAWPWGSAAMMREEANREIGGPRDDANRDTDQHGKITDSEL